MHEEQNEKSAVEEEGDIWKRGSDLYVISRNSFCGA